jgi:Zn finger protein HypA/HybF involved in hydrogenase expression
LNAFVHVSLPERVLVDIEESKLKCKDCGKIYFSDEVHDEEHDVHIEPYTPKDDHCGDCGSSNFEEGSNPINFE